MTWPIPLPPMDILIDEEGVPTKELCITCRSRNRFFFIHEVVFQEATRAKARDFFRVCPWCDTRPPEKE